MPIIAVEVDGDDDGMNASELEVIADVVIC